MIIYVFWGVSPSRPCTAGLVVVYIFSQKHIPEKAENLNTPKYKKA
jgi:hypothetical protein